MTIPKGVEFTMTDNLVYVQGKEVTVRQVLVKGKKGEMVLNIDKAVVVEVSGNLVSVKPATTPHPMVGTTCKLLKNMVQGVNDGFETKLSLVGVGYRAKISGKFLDLSLGFSHPVLFEIPEGLTIDVPSNTEVVIKGIDKQLVGETAAKIRAIRPPERYKGKGVRYFNEVVVLKETKKK